MGASTDLKDKVLRLLQFLPGQTVTIVDLQNDSQHNGKTAKILAYLTDGKRWGVELNGGERLGLCAKNLKLFQEAQPTVTVAPKVDETVEVSKTSSSGLQDRQSHQYSRTGQE